MMVGLVVRRTREELIRYARHLVLPGVGEEGRQRLKEAKVL